MSVYTDVVVVMCDWCGQDRNVYRDGIASDARGWQYAELGSPYQMLPVTQWWHLTGNGFEHKCDVCAARDLVE